jgi:MFS family permease
VASALAAAAPSVELLVAARVVQALGAALLVPTSLALLLSATPVAKRTAYVGAWAAVGGVAAAAGPPIGGLLVQLSWRWVFIVNLPVAAVALYAAVRTLREERDETASGLPDLLGAVVLTLGVGALTAGIVEGPEWGWDGRVLALFGAAVVLLAWFAARTARHPVPVVEPDLLRVRSFAAANLSAMAFFAGFGAMLLGGVLFLTRVWNEDVLTAGLMISPGPLMAATFSVLGAKLVDRIGHRAVAMLGGVAFAAGSLFWSTQMGADASYASEFLPGFIVGGIGVGLVIPTLSGAAAAALPPHRFATGSAVFGMSRQLGSALGVAILVAVVGTPAPAEAVDAFREGVYIVVAGGLLTSLAAAFMGRIQIAGAPQAEPAVA